MKQKDKDKEASGKKAEDKEASEKRQMMHQRRC